MSMQRSEGQKLARMVRLSILWAVGLFIGIPVLSAIGLFIAIWNQEHNACAARPEIQNNPKLCANWLHGY